MRNILLLDMFNIYYRILKVEKSHDVVSRFLSFITKISIESGMDWNAVYCCFDSHKYHRKLIYSEYKANRGQSSELSGNALALWNTMAQLGFSVLKCDGFEADDLIAQLCNQFPDDRKVIVSTDEDLYQLLSKNTLIYQNRGKKIVTEKSFTATYGILPKDWVLVKAIAGCTSDNIMGVPGVGEKTAIAYLRGEKSQKIDEHYYMVKRNIQLVQLPFRDNKRSLPDIAWENFKLNYDYMKFVNCNPYDMMKGWSYSEPSLMNVFDF